MTGPVPGQPLARLGETTDPAALVPGDPDLVDADAAALTLYQEVFGTVADDLAAVRVPGWSGVAADAFRAALGGEVPHWTHATDAMGAAAGALTDYAGELRAAQLIAAQAIQVWAQGEWATAAAVAAYRGAVAQANAAGRADLVRPFTDPGDPLRREAEEILARAREQLAAASVTAEGALADCSGRDPGAPPWLSDSADSAARYLDEHGTGDLSGSWDAGHLGWEDRRTHGDRADSGPEPRESRVDVGLGEWEAEANLYEERASGRTRIGSVDVAGTAEAEVGSDSSATLSAGSDGVHAEVRNRTGASATVTGTAGVPSIGVGGTGEVFAGSDMGAELSVGRDGVDVGGDVFVGGKAGTEGHVDVAGVQAGGNVEGRAGFGADAHVTAGVEDGKLVIDAAIGAAFGLGLGFGGEVTVDGTEFADTLVDGSTAVHEMGEAMTDPGSLTNVTDGAGTDTGGGSEGLMGRIAGAVFG
ncbi:putative T7SS-secreted protein [Actinophytocola sp.]|uniref:putative T7SS-secreted protein n=1 Tax=Actinophytocola sp. TaxID=1872138 RepID=UPI003D6A60BE